MVPQKNSPLTPTTDDATADFTPRSRRKTLLSALSLAALAPLTLSACVGLDVSTVDGEERASVTSSSEEQNTASSQSSGEREEDPEDDDQDNEDQDDDRGDRDGQDRNGRDDDRDRNNDRDDDRDRDRENSEGDVPEFEDAMDESMEAMSEAESVTIHAEGEGFPQEFHELLDMHDEGQMGLTMSGSLEDDATSIIISSGNDEMEILMVDGETYLSGQAFADFLAAEIENDPELGALIDPEDISYAIGDYWIDMTYEFDTPAAESLQLSTFFEEFHDSWGNRDLHNGAFSATTPGELDEYEGQDVWVYSENDAEAVISAEDEPYLLQVTGPDEEGTITFEDWDEADIPEKPAASDVLTEDDMIDLLAGMMY